MKTLSKVLVLVLFFSSSAHAVSIDELIKTVVFLRQQSHVVQSIEGKPAEMYYRYLGTQEYKPVMETRSGSGFIIRYKGRDYLVTAKHVANLLPRGEIVINLPNGKTTIITFQQLTQADKTKRAHWFHHPKADISIHPMAYPTKDVEVLAISENLFPKKEPDLKLLNTVNIVGFPLGLGVSDKLSPVAKEAKIVSMLTSIENINIPKDLHFYLLDQALSEGYSGAPVFYIEDTMSGFVIGNQLMKGGEMVHLLGVQSTSLADQTGGKFSLVVPILYIWDIFESPDFEAYIKDIESKK